ncbi:interleukin-6 receptor subunit alpha [Heteronotia binoei]|uniref:interleukin-6 receptor subunit alpha n=1 Tax=Heteronotia binoei TaxID=13085 RepID=UPI00292F2605|nr:interleukin-6 receptor subunit alpha [Heteronotia binoei]
MWLAGASLTVSLIIATVGLVEPGLLCPHQGLLPDTMVSPPGTNVTLPCLEGELENTTNVQWRFNGRNISSDCGRLVLEGPRLFLPSVYYNNSGLYTCHAGGRILRSVRLLVEEPPEVPDFTCFRRSFTKDILCEWKPSRQLCSRTKAKFWVGKGLMGGNHTEHQCRYYSKSQKFTCRIAMTHYDEDITLRVTMCVTNAAGTATSEQKYYRTSNLVKPDPPENVQVMPVEKAPRKLLVTWRYPSSWGSKIYHLRFQLRYRADISQTYSEVELPLEMTSHVIHDALQNLPHRVQVRAHEEFDYGTWSEWSRESTGTPWTEPPEAESETTTSDIPKVTDYSNFVTSNVSTTPAFPTESEQPAAAADMALHTFLIPAVTVILGLALVVGIIIRYRKKWWTPSSGEAKAKAIPSYSLVLQGSGAPLSSSPLLTPPASPFSESSVDSPRILENSPYDVSNADYFLLPR